MKLQMNHIFQEYFQNLVDELELRSDGAGKQYNWTISKLEEVTTTKAEAPTQDGTLKLQMSPVSKPTDGAVQHIHGSESEWGGRYIDTNCLSMETSISIETS